MARFEYTSPEARNLACDELAALKTPKWPARWFVMAWPQDESDLTGYTLSSWNDASDRANLMQTNEYKEWWLLELGFINKEAVRELPLETMQMLYSDYIKRLNQPVIMQVTSFELTHRELFLESLHSVNFEKALSHHPGAFMVFAAHSESSSTASLFGLFENAAAHKELLESQPWVAALEKIYEGVDAASIREQTMFAQSFHHEAPEYKELPTGVMGWLRSMLGK